MSTGREVFAKFMVFFGYFMVIIYLRLGSSLFFKQVLPDIPQNLKYTFAVFYLAYGVLRFVKMVSGKKENDE